MSITFSTIGTCTAPAVVCIEGYSPRDGRAHGSLDVAVHACEEHAETARTEWLASLTPYSTTTQGRRCGEMTTYADLPTGEPLVGAAARDMGRRLRATLDHDEKGVCPLDTRGTDEKGVATTDTPGAGEKGTHPVRTPGTEESATHTVGTPARRQPGEMPRDVYDKAVALVATEVLRKSYELDYGTATTEQLTFLVGTLTRSLGDVLGILGGTAPGPFTQEAGQ